MDNKKEKCFSINLDQEVVESLQEIKKSSGKSQGQLLKESVESGLRETSFFLQGNNLFLAKVRIDGTQLEELGAKLQSGELKTDRILFTYCEKKDPTVGVSLWVADDRDHLDQFMAPYQKYYKEVIDIEEMVTTSQSIERIMESLSI